MKHTGTEAAGCKILAVSCISFSTMDYHFVVLQPWRLNVPPGCSLLSWQRSRLPRKRRGFQHSASLNYAFPDKTRNFVLCVSVPSLRQPSPPHNFLAGSSNLTVSSRISAPSALARGHLQHDFKEELDQLLGLLPKHIKERLKDHPELSNLVEIVMDLGRLPVARFPSGDFPLWENVITMSDLDQAVALVGDFADDNRAGIDRTLHRISAIRNRAGRIVGLTCRVGRAISGSAEMVRDLVASGGSLLLMGPPGVGKTTAIREISRILADDYYRRVVIVDTSNEIAGDGDIPHAGIGQARRMQVPNVGMQHEVMIEAVENHMPQSIVIDEIGTELEALAAGTIAQRGVQLVGTAHGMTIENLIKNPSLQNLAGGIQSVTLGDDEARRRGVQKSVLERKGPPTFTAAAEMISRTEWRIHRSLAATVDALLAGRTPQFEVRRMNEDGQVLIGNSFDGKGTLNHISDSKRTSGLGGGSITDDDDGDIDVDDDENDDEDDEGEGSSMEQRWQEADAPLLLYTYQITEANLDQVMEVMGLENVVQLTDDIAAANAILALRTKIKQNTWIRDVARLRQLPIYAIKANTMAQMVRALRTMLGMETLGASTLIPSSRIKEDTKLKAEGSARKHAKMKTDMEDEIDALEEARLAIEKIVIPKGQPVELLPRSISIISLQMKLVESYQFMTEKAGTEENLRLRILPIHNDGHWSGNSEICAEISDDNSSEGFGVSGTSVSRLPILPE